MQTAGHCCRTPRRARRPPSFREGEQKRRRGEGVPGRSAAPPIDDALARDLIPDARGFLAGLSDRSDSLEVASRRRRSEPTIRDRSEGARFLREFPRGCGIPAAAGHAGRSVVQRVSDRARVRIPLRARRRDHDRASRCVASSPALSLRIASPADFFATADRRDRASRGERSARERHGHAARALQSRVLASNPPRPSGPAPELLVTRAGSDRAPTSHSFHFSRHPPLSTDRTDHGGRGDGPRGTHPGRARHRG